MLQHIFFDNDGTIVDSEILAVYAMLDHLTEFGISMDLSTYSMRYPGLVDRDIMRLIEQEYEVEFPEDFVPKLHASHKRLFDSELKVIEGMDAILKDIKVPASMVSNGSVLHVERCFDRVKLRDLMPPRIFSYEHVPLPKPAPDVYLHAMQQVDVPARHAIAIEDSATGVASAKAAGLKVVGFMGAGHISAGHEVRLLEAGADFLAENARELRVILERLGGL